MEGQPFATPEQFAKELATLKMDGPQPTFREMAVGKTLTWKANNNRSGEPEHAHRGGLPPGSARQFGPIKSL